MLDETNTVLIKHWINSLKHFLQIVQNFNFNNDISEKNFCPWKFFLSENRP